MIKVSLRAVWRVRSKAREEELDQLLIAVLGGLEESGKLTVSAKAAGVSHRHARNLILRWGDFLGAPLVVMKQGLGTHLTPLGKSVLWAGRRVQSRLAPELDGLAGDFARDINQALGKRDTPLVIHASHDFAVALLRERLNATGMGVDLQSRGSFDALASLERGDCDIAGFHVANGPLGELMARRYIEGLKHNVRLILLAHRRQGLIVARGNPKQINTVTDLARPGVRLINRQRGSGTRALFEFLLSEAGIDRSAIVGYETEEITHSAVAALVAGQQADAGFGIEAAAARFHLEFVPIATERYYLAIDAARLTRPDVQALLANIAMPSFADAVNAIPGYTATIGNKLLTVPEAIGGATILSSS